jgi:hypothetical protein
MVLVLFEVVQYIHIPHSRASIHGIHSVFLPTYITKHEGGKEPILQSKLDKGQGNFESLKDMIGIDFNGVNRKVRLPAEKARQYIKETHSMLRRKTVPMKLFRTVVGKITACNHYPTGSKRFLHTPQQTPQDVCKVYGVRTGGQIHTCQYFLSHTLHWSPANPRPRVGTRHATVYCIPRYSSGRKQGSLVFIIAEIFLEICQQESRLSL